ncbi:hypothetical protein [Bacillus sp. AFS053548]|uniref:hypothetical protein n=1 Tax=Bacillus sp. AFS053548 TaxID=2033505 RepID=UPI00159B8718|nr:hypothetical protein [Bacillus sp. AFS053548]
MATIVAHLKQALIEKLWDLPYVHGTSLTIIHFGEEKELEFEVLCDTGHLDRI